ncbi:MAG TPA: endonuclease/exonuclease/phosphatase family protein [Chitinophaga sp.]|uniref:endonuclease/exonuclease/phosphatase family protein n=1 Tax=Chitinophaga sp. TaxID=1869181 RepID=UPI002BE54DCB|nr:endonuclease/exonuclease/phosphatase family protein [Chitinophaga sp.]HVI43666.1 endonuclease/exonuclease/phosphatase family protein [Chitinophaga sp.]
MYKGICILLIVLLLLSAYLPVLNPGQYWLSGFASMAFPFIFLACLVTVPLCWFFSKRYALLTLIAVLLCLKPATYTWGTHLFHNNAIPASSGVFSIMTYNTSSMGLSAYKTDTVVRAAVFDVVAGANPDILCLQEFYTNDDPGKRSHHIDSLRQIGKYPYHYFTCDWVNWNTWYYGLILFSRYPIAAATTIPCNETAVGSGKSFLQADLVVHGDTIRVLTAQFISYMFSRDDIDNLLHLRSWEILTKMRQTFIHRSHQAVQLAALAAASPYPVIICGDLNDTPASFTYMTVSRGLQDAFLVAGAGWGRTLSYLSPSLRIDYILPNPSFRIHSCEVPQPQRSEHFPVMARLSLKKH